MKTQDAAGQPMESGSPVRATRGWIARLSLLILVPTVIVQAAVLTQHYLLPWGRDIWALRNQPPWERSARLSAWLRTDDVDFLQFLHEQTPAEAELAFFGSSGLYSWRGLLQYLLFPRRITICNEAAELDCLAVAVESGKHLVAVDGHPGIDVVPSGWRYTAFGSDRGFYRP